MEKLKGLFALSTRMLGFSLLSWSSQFQLDMCWLKYSPTSMIEYVYSRPRKRYGWENFHYTKWKLRLMLSSSLLASCLQPKQPNQGGNLKFLRSFYTSFFLALARNFEASQSRNRQLDWSGCKKVLISKRLVKLTVPYVK